MQWTCWSEVDLLVTFQDYRAGMSRADEEEKQKRAARLSGEAPPVPTREHASMFEPSSKGKRSDGSFGALLARITTSLSCTAKLPTWYVTAVGDSFRAHLKGFSCILGVLACSHVPTSC
jgi:hypothetical protein